MHLDVFELVWFKFWYRDSPYSHTTPVVWLLGK